MALRKELEEKEEQQLMHQPARILLWKGNEAVVWRRIGTQWNILQKENIAVCLHAEKHKPVEREKLIVQNVWVCKKENEI